MSPQGRITLVMTAGAVGALSAGPLGALGGVLLAGAVSNGERALRAQDAGVREGTLALAGALAGALVLHAARGAR